eukprot:CAMPEP_0119410852 /NCGR_PEP_ID=MMETSP1335-20130426/3763_1 /TAXON_ID=259385 /ORGANISM="Chrysoculter rhomboideus, Strain RCC1486" /LENGTH=119 /DNA_ID=CAMNT_0007435443 /DNA_START=47 /DNA_END=406 /DNA_ORIENTATION=+
MTVSSSDQIAVTVIFTAAAAAAQQQARQWRLRAHFSDLFRLFILELRAFFPPRCVASCTSRCLRLAYLRTDSSAISSATMVCRLCLRGSLPLVYSAAPSMTVPTCTRDGSAFFLKSVDL